MKTHCIEPNWPAPPGIRAYSTTRLGGQSLGPYAGFNLALHVGDDPQIVGTNRRLLRTGLGLPAEPFWLNQVHGTEVVEALPITANPAIAPTADASFSRNSGAVCVVMTADCLPVLFCDRAGTTVAAAHAGWRGLADGVLEATVQALGEGDWMAWLGPAIGPLSFEVGPPVRQAFMERLGDCAEAFQQIDDSHWLADLYGLARLILARAGVSAVYGGDYCTHADPERFFSYRRNGQTGRMASLIWRE
jgi:hypothetical protein